MFNKKNFCTVWGSAAVLTLLSWFGFKAVSRVTDKLTAPKPVKQDTPLQELKGSHAVDMILKGPDTGNVAALYEKMCVLEPVLYKDVPRLPSVIAKYRKIINGEVTDRSRKHVPSDILEGSVNPDYLTYLTNQARALGNPKWINEELHRVERMQETQDLRAEYGKVLQELGMPEVLISSVLTAERLESYTADDWRKLASFCKDQSQEYTPETLIAFLGTFLEKEIALDAKALEIYAVLTENGVPEKVTKDIVRGKVSIEQAQRILALVNEEGFEWDEAVDQVIEEETAVLEHTVLRERYRSLVKGE